MIHLTYWAWLLKYRLQDDQTIILFHSFEVCVENPFDFCPELTRNLVDENGEKNWYLFNDFLVKQVAESEVLDFTPNWKSPVMLIYQKRVDIPPFDVDEWKSRLDTSILYRDHFSAGYVDCLN